MNCSYLEIYRDQVSDGKVNFKHNHQLIKTVILRDKIIQDLLDKKSPPKDDKSSDAETLVLDKVEQEQDNSLRHISLRKFKRLISINKA